jgi:hypothetical protein
MQDFKNMLKIFIPLIIFCYTMLLLANVLDTYDKENPKCDKTITIFEKHSGIASARKFGCFLSTKVDQIGE